MTKPRYTLDELLAGAETSGAYPLSPEEREWVDAPAVGREVLVEDLQSAQAIHAYLAHAEASGDAAYIEHAREIAAQAKISIRGEP
ncbi:helix-turn-helix domain-containing protein [Orrella marina]|uniref:Growth regulator n=1 Tax=Orrella marina TaxID=2163011 RepID=A0A2R4XFL5_9BURK|nr:Growth regulator [Orrella marina]AWB32503.1 Growth regulator [Orrella marina]